MPGQTLMFKNAVDAMLRYVRVPQISGVVRQEPAKKTQQDDEAKPVKKKLLTIAKIARKLRQIEGGSRYEEASFFASKIGWEGICGLVEVGHPENDPNLMPSRYMILPGADDESLRRKGNLNNFSHPVHANTPKQMSVFNLKQFLILGGYLSGDKPYWQTLDQKSLEELSTLKSDGGLESTEVSPLSGAAEMDSQVQSALNDFLGKHSLPDPQGGSSYTIKEGDTLSSIAESHDFPSWQSLWKHNSHIIKNPDLIFPGDEIDLPDLRNDDLEPWFHEFDNGADVWQGGNHYQFPASYFSLSFVTDDLAPIKNIKDGLFEAYIKDPTQLFYSLNINAYDDVSLLLPYNEGLQIWAPGFLLKGINDNNVDIQSLLSSNGSAPAETDQVVSLMDGLSINSEQYKKADYSEDE
jgi:hypothetical protein